MTVDAFLLNAEVQVQTCYCIPAKSSTLSQQSCLGSAGSRPPLKASYLLKPQTWADEKKTAGTSDQGADSKTFLKTSRSLMIKKWLLLHEEHCSHA